MNKEIVIESTEHLNTIMNKESTLILFFDTNCWGVGKAIFPRLKDLAIKYDVKVLSINIESQLEIKGQFLVFSAPTVLIINEQIEELIESGFIDFQKIDRILGSLFRA